MAPLNNVQIEVSLSFGAEGYVLEELDRPEIIEPKNGVPPEHKDGFTLLLKVIYKPN